MWSCPKAGKVADAVAEEAEEAEEEDVEGWETFSVTIARSTVICLVTAEAGEHLGEEEDEEEDEEADLGNISTFPFSDMIFYMMFAIFYISDAKSSRLIFTLSKPQSPPK